MTHFGRAWTKREDTALRASYADAGLVAARVALPHRSNAALRQRARVLGVNRCRRWTRDEERVLRDRWGIDSIQVIAKALLRTVKATYDHADIIGLQVGCPRGLEYIGTAATRTGFDQKDLRRILRWAGVRYIRAYTAPQPGRRCLRRVVDPLDVDDAVAKWLKTETLAAAARRIGMLPNTLVRWMRQSGVDMGRRTSNAFRSHFRVDPELVDRVVATHRREENLETAASRHHMCKRRLLVALVEAGARVPVLAQSRTRYRWWFDPEFVDRVVRDLKEKRHGKEVGQDHGTEVDGGIRERLATGVGSLQREATGRERLPDVAAE